VYSFYGEALRFFRDFRYRLHEAIFGVFQDFYTFPAEAFRFFYAAPVQPLRA